MKKVKSKRKSHAWLFSFLIVMIALITAHSASAQGKISGQVRDSAGGPVKGATIKLKNKKVFTTSGEDGSFSITASSDDVLQITSVGFEPLEIRVGANTQLNLSLTSRATAMDDVVVVGYGTQRKKDLTAAVSAINMADARKYTTSDMSQLLQGRAAGVTVNSDGQPGAVPSVRIRGFGTFNNAQPFYVVDGVPGVNIRDFSPDDVESMTVLKDAASAAIYGAAAANGVIIVTTRQGKKGLPMKISYNGYYGWDKVWQRQKVTDRVQYQTLNN